MSFSNLGLSPSLCAPLARKGLQRAHPRPVRGDSARSWKGADLLARAQTGTGKTAAFGLPMIERLLVRGGARDRARGPRGLVLVPTRELAVQVHRSLLDLRVAGAVCARRRSSAARTWAARSRSSAAAPTSSSRRRAA